MGKRSRFIRLGKGNKINPDLVDYITTSKDRYFIKDIYGLSFEVDKKRYEEAKKYLGEEVERK